MPAFAALCIIFIAVSDKPRHGKFRRFGGVMIDDVDLAKNIMEYFVAGGVFDGCPGRRPVAMGDGWVGRTIGHDYSSLSSDLVFL